MEPEVAASTVAVEAPEAAVDVEVDPVVSEYTDAPVAASTLEVDPALDADVVAGRPVAGSIATWPSVKTALESPMVPVDDAVAESPPKTCRTSCIKISPKDDASEGAVSVEGVAAVALSSVGVDPI